MATGPAPPDALDTIAAAANSAPAAGHPDPEIPPAHPPRPPQRRGGRWLAAALLGVLAALLAAIGTLWWWAGTDGSLATALRWAGARLPLHAEAATGSLRAGGTVQRLVWSQDGLRVEVDDAELRWTPAALLARTLRIERLAARRIRIDDQRPAGAPSAGPPPSLALPLHVQVDALRVDELQWAGPPARALHDVAARYDYDGARHRLELEHARFQDGRWHARATLGDEAPIRLDLALAGALAPPLPDAPTTLPLTLQATLRGPLAELHAQADVQAVPAAAGASAPVPALPPLPDALAPSPVAPADTGTDTGTDTEGAPRAHATARITPWAPQPLPEAHATLQSIDLGALWPAAPRTQLGGRVDLAPLPAADAATTPGWAVTADLANTAAGPWDRQRLPVDALQADLSWQGDTATVRTLRAQLGGGTLQASGRWQRAPAGASAAAAPPWQIDAQLADIDPARLHTQLAALPIDGQATVQGAGEAIDFDATLQARAGARTAAPQDKGTPGRALRELRALRLHDLHARGRWADKVLTLEQLRIRTDDAQLAGSATLQGLGTATPGGRADITATAPGLGATVQGELHATRGAGTAQVKLTDAARTLAWLRRWPGVADALAGADARGSATLQARWQGGWQNPELHASLTAPRLSVTTATDAPPIEARQLTLGVDGTLAQARIDAQGQLTQGERQLDLQLALEGGRTGPKAALADSSWRATVQRLQARVRDPALGAGIWQLASRNAVAVSASPAQGGQVDVGAGELVVTSPAPTAQATLAWGPARWHGGELSTTGRLTGLPLQWIERIAGTQMQDAGLDGNVVFNGSWDAALGRTLRVQAELARASGDVTLHATDPDTGVQTQVAAGLRQARLTLGSDGHALELKLAWDSARAGRIDARLRTDLAATTDAAGRTHWAWPESAPLQGEVRAQLPQISVWSVLAPPGWRLRGSLALDARVGGTRAAPQLTGTASADDLALRSVVDGIQFEDGRLRARLDGTRVLIDEFSLRGAGRQGGGGRLTARGEAGWIDGRGQARLDATLEQLRASIQSDRQITVSGRVQAALDGRALRADGQLKVDHALIVLPDESRPALSDDIVVHGAGGRTAQGQEAPGTLARPPAPPRSASSRQTAPPTGTPPMTAKVDVKIDLGPDFRVEGRGLDTRLAGTLSLAADGPLDGLPQVTGLVQTEGGRFHAYSQNMDITRGRITFTGTADNPTLDIIALRPNFASDQQAGVQVAGTALLPRVRLYSNPPLPDSQTLAWLMLGRAAPATGAEAAMLQSAALAVLGGRNGRGLASRFGLDELSVAGGGDGDTVAGASVTLGKRLSNRLYAAYEHSLAGTGGALMIFYELSRRWSLRGQAGETSAVDLIYKLSFD